MRDLRFGNVADRRDQNVMGSHHRVRISRCFSAVSKHFDPRNLSDLHPDPLVTTCLSWSCFSLTPDDKSLIPRIACIGSRESYRNHLIVNELDAVLQLEFADARPDPYVGQGGRPRIGVCLSTECRLKVICPRIWERARSASDRLS